MKPTVAAMAPPASQFNEYAVIHTLHRIISRLVETVDITLGLHDAPIANILTSGYIFLVPKQKIIGVVILNGRPKLIGGRTSQALVPCLGRQTMERV